MHIQTLYKMAGPSRAAHEEYILGSWLLRRRVGFKEASSTISLLMSSFFSTATLSFSARVFFLRDPVVYGALVVSSAFSSLDDQALRRRIPEVNQLRVRLMRGL